MAKTKALISFAVTAKLICVFVFAYAKSRFSHDTAHFPKILDTLNTADVEYKVRKCYGDKTKLRIIRFRFTQRYFTTE